MLAYRGRFQFMWLFPSGNERKYATVVFSQLPLLYFLFVFITISLLFEWVSLTRCFLHLGQHVGHQSLFQSLPNAVHQLFLLSVTKTLLTSISHTYIYHMKYDTVHHSKGWNTWYLHLWRWRPYREAEPCWARLPGSSPQRRTAGPWWEPHWCEGHWQSLTTGSYLCIQGLHLQWRMKYYRINSF